MKRKRFWQKLSTIVFKRGLVFPFLFSLLFLFVHLSYSQVRGLDSVEQQLMTQAWVPVLVKLKVDLQGARTLQDRASAIRSVQDRVLSRFAGDELRLGYQYQTVTGFSARVNQLGLEKIAEDPLVEAIAIDRKVYVTLEQSRPLINADDTETNLFVTGKNITVAVMDTGVQTSHAVLSNDIAGDFQILTGPRAREATMITGMGPMWRE